MGRASHRERPWKAIAERLRRPADSISELINAPFLNAGGTPAEYRAVAGSPKGAAGVS